MNRRENATRPRDCAPESRDPTDSGISRAGWRSRSEATLVTELIENGKNRGNLYTTIRSGGKGKELVKYKQRTRKYTSEHASEC